MGTYCGLQDFRTYLPVIFFLWGHLKSRIFATYVPNLQTLKERIQEEVEAIPHRMLASVMDNSVRQLHKCISQNGGYLPGVIFKK
jgi:hypothetical protein